MTARKAFVLLVFLLVIVKAQEASAALLEALAYVPNTETSVMFSNIALIKQYENAEEVTGSSSAEVQADFFRTARERQAILVDQQLQRPEYTQLWGWNTFDLRWIVTLSGDAPLSIFAFRDDIDLNTFITLLQERGFTKTSVGEATFFQGERDLAADWFRFNLQIVNTAILEQEKIVVMSASPEYVEAVLEAHTSNTTYASVDSIQTITEQLGEVATAILETNNCVTYGTDAIARQVLGPTASPEKLEEIIERLEADLAEVSPYQTLALAYRYETDKPLGTLILNYTNTTDASNDLAARQQGADEGMSFAINKPYRESVFSLESATANGNNLILTLHPVKDQPARLFQMLYQRDMAFARC